MRFAEEVVAAHFVPTWRGMLARALTARGLSQTEIAALLGVTQSAVSKHLRGELGSSAVIERDPRVRETAERVARGLAEKTLSPFEALHASESLVRVLEDRGPICQLHEQEMPALQGLGCDICVAISTHGSPLLAEQAALQDLRAALRILEAIPGLARLVPHVGANLARAIAGARDATQVAAVPGRLFVARGALKVPAPPEFGVSRHSAEVLLAVHRAAPQRLAVLNLAPDAAFLDAARRKGLRVAKVAPDFERAPSDLRFDGREVPDLFYHEGAFGIEPQAYVTAADAQALALLVRELMALGPP